MIRNQSIEFIFGQLLIMRGAALAPKCASLHGAWISQDYSMFLSNVGDGTTTADRFGWRFFSEAEMGNLDTIMKRKRLVLPDSMAAETYVVFGEQNDGVRYFLFRTHRPKSTTPLIYMFVGNRLVAFADDFEEFIRKLRHELETNSEQEEADRHPTAT